LYLPSSNTLGFASNSIQSGYFSSGGVFYALFGIGGGNF
jgi:hypothetical protein